MCGINAARLVEGEELIKLPATTIIGALCRYLESDNADFQPMNANFGILPPLENKTREKAKNKLLYSDRSLKDLEKVCSYI